MGAVRVVRAVAWLVVVLCATSAVGGELFPGRIRGVSGLQQFTAAEYNPDRDEYALGYSDGSPLVSILSTDGVWEAGTEIALAGNTGITHLAIAYNTVRSEYLVIWRNGSPNYIRGQYLTTDLTPIGGSFYIGNGYLNDLGNSLAYSPDSDLYMVTFTLTLSTGNRVIRYRMISGDSTLPGVVRGGDLVAGGVLSDAVAYGSVPEKFLIVYTKDNVLPAGANIAGALVNKEGTVVEAHFAIDNSQNNQQGPVLTYSVVRNRWVVGYEDWENAGSRSADFKGALVAPNGTVTGHFFFNASSSWDVPGPLTYNAVTETVVAPYRIASNSVPKAFAREFDPQDGGAANPLGDPILLSDLRPAPGFDGAFPLAAASRTVDSGPQALVLWRLNNGGDGVHAGIVHLTPAITTIIRVETPPNGDATVSAFDVSGWAVDPDAPTGTGVDAIHVWAFPAGGGDGIFLGAASYGSNRPDVGTYIGDPRFDPSGYQLSNASLANYGDYTIRVYARRTISGEFDASVDFSLSVGPDPRMAVEQPAATSTVSWPFIISGWAIDRAAPSGTGVDTVHVWAFPAGSGGDFGLATFLGAATMGFSRADIGNTFGAQFVLSGFELESTKLLTPGDYTFKGFAHDTITGTFNNTGEVPVTVQAVTRTEVELPSNGSTVGPPFTVRGWAFNTGTPGSVGVDTIHVWAFPSSGSSIFLGGATLGISRPDVASFFGVSEFDPSGFRLVVTTPLPVGAYTLRVYVRNTTTSQFDAFPERSVTVSTDARMNLETPTEGATVATPFTVAGWAVDLAASMGTGVDAVHVWAFPTNGSPGTFLGAATLGISRPDVASFFGDSELELSGFNLNVTTPLASGTYTLTIFGRSTVTGMFNRGAHPNSSSRSITVP